MSTLQTSGAEDKTMVVRMRSTKGHRDHRRAHHKLTAPALSACTECKAPTPPHTACAACGKYRGMTIQKLKVKGQKEK